jgi:hypothetical protein
MPPASDSNTSDAIRDAAHNAVAVASLHWQQSVTALRHILVTAHNHGLSMDELVVASGIQRANILRLIADGHDI